MYFTPVLHADHKAMQAIKHLPYITKRMTDTNDLLHIFKEKFNQNPIISKAPGRINLIGEHTDYNQGFVLPASIDKEAIFALAPNGTDRCAAYSCDLKESFEFELAALEPCEKGWANYIIGVVSELKKAGADIKGFNCVFTGNVPIGSGLSSSASIECALAMGLKKSFNLTLDPFEIVKACQMAEHHYVGVRCGIMDQFISTFGKKNHVLRLDCRSLEYQYFPLELDDCCFILCNTKVHHSLASSEYNVRREQCESGVSTMQKHFPEVQSLRDLTQAQLDSHKEELDPVVYQRCRYVINENQRVMDTCEALENNDLQQVGQLLYQSHHGLSKEYEVSCPELDILVDYTRDKDEVLGARMMGGGFGGCTLNLVKKDRAASFIEEASAFYLDKTGKEMEAYTVVIGDGAIELSK
ncbi:MAG: galactokinase [Cytophagales bacterium]|nr:galactokinase [Cytophagales bacterium]